VSTDVENPMTIDRGAPLVAAPLRWLAFAAGEIVGFALLGYGFIALTHSKRTLESLALPLAIAVGITALATWAMLRAEESRLARELRTARTGTATIRGMVVSRRQKLPVVLRLFSTTLGTAAVLLADGERNLALDALAAGSPIMMGGRIQRLRAILEADAERASGTAAGLERAVNTLRAAESLGNREGDLYRTHVLVKALLEQANGELASELHASLAKSADEEERLYAVWLRTWFELEDEDPVARAQDEDHEGELRLALLLARSQGAAELVTRLEAKLAALSPLQAPPSPST
jgi:hypothetical protein